ncbi:MAG: CNNM domain-containing protein [Candidatus Nanoarchaeia archaeon]|nr:CNNM domain-containing protein [Candidatus Nanoarchaeia archaeon]
MVLLTTQIIILACLIFLSALFSSTETAMFSISEIKLHHLLAQNKWGAKTLQKLKRDSHKLLITILIGNNVVNIGAASLATSIAINAFGNIGIGIATGAMTLIILIFGEIMPKAIATVHATKIALPMAVIIDILKILMFPLVWFLDKFVGILVPKGDPFSVRLTEEEVIDMVNLSGEQGSIKLQEREMIENIFELDDTPVSEVMTPRPDVEALEDHLRVDDVIAQIKEKGYSRIPLYKGDLDHITGVLYTKDLLMVDGRKQLKSIAKAPFFVHETKLADQLLREFKIKKNHLAIVVNEHGTMLGIVTIEDLLEEIVGEIYDETDTIEDITPDIRKINETDYVMRGKAEIDDVERVLNIHLDDEDNSTLSGFIVKKLAHIPKEGEHFKLHGYKFVIKEVNTNRVEKVFVIGLKKKDQFIF